ncbi:hypothetical protein ACL02T_25590 [Pseudonocardia sp. RS010]|uniref:hypothetical protein n=1 Tax=Pseudonocardia sp. RS010 TaxID=3385979 RepID=UPI0039A0008D
MRHEFGEVDEVDDGHEIKRDPWVLRDQGLGWGVDDVPFERDDEAIRRALGQVALAEFARTEAREAELSWTVGQLAVAEAVREGRDASADQVPDLRPGTPEIDPRQSELRARDFANARKERTSESGASLSFEITYPDGRKAVFKPKAGEWFAEQLRGSPLREGVETGTYYERDVAVYEVDRELGFGLVPTTTTIDTPSGVGSLQDHAPLPPRPPERYTELDRQMLGTLDYITGALDRHPHNVMTQSDGRPAAIDNDLTFPVDTGEPLRSEFFPDVLGRPLDPSIVEAVRQLAPETLTEILSRHGVPDAAIKGAVDRRNEAATGLITGRAWPAGFVTFIDVEGRP